jgi:hypothetical protein
MQKITCDDRCFQLNDDVAHALLDVIAMAKRDGKAFDLEIPVRSGPTMESNMARVTITPSTRFELTPVLAHVASSHAVPSSVAHSEKHGRPFSSEDALMTNAWDDL